MNMLHNPWSPFADLSEAQLDLLRRYESLVLEANRRVNLVSRASVGDFMDRHVAHSLCIAVRAFPRGARVADFGTGGGLPGVPLAIRFPNVDFILIDSVRKKTDALTSFVAALDLKNTTVWRGRAEEWRGSATHIVSRATTSLAQLWTWSKPKISVGEERTDERVWPRGLICLKGGDLEAEIAQLRSLDPETGIDRISLKEIDAFFAGKVVVSIHNKKGRK